MSKCVLWVQGFQFRKKFNSRCWRRLTINHHGKIPTISFHIVPVSMQEEVEIIDTATVMMKRKLFDAYCHGNWLLIGGLWRKFPSKQTKKNRWSNQKQRRIQKKINWFFNSMWLLVADRIPESKCWNENVSTRKSNKLYRADFFSYPLFTHYVNWNAVLWLDVVNMGLWIYIHVLFSKQIEAAFIVERQPNARKYSKSPNMSETRNFFGNVPQALILLPSISMIPKKITFIK